MAQTIKLKRSTGSAPPASLGFGELAYTDGDEKLYIGKDGGGIKDLFDGSSSGSTDLVNIDNTAQATLLDEDGDYLLTANNIAVTLPPNPTSGVSITLRMLDGNLLTGCTVDPSTKEIMGTLGLLNYDIANPVTFKYSNLHHWQIILGG